MSIYWLTFLKSISWRKNRRGRGELLLKMVQEVVTFITRPDLYCAEPLALTRFSQNLLAIYR